jgi:DNA processing protein
MDPSTALAWFALGVLTKRRYDMLLKRFGSLGNALLHLDRELLAALRCKEETVERTLKVRSAFCVPGYAERMGRESISFVSWEDDDYPALLRQIGDPPVFLSYRGDLSLLSKPCLGMVGTRAMSSYGVRVVETFIPEIVGAGVVTVSGLALGVDAAVARETLAQHGKTVAILGHGLAKIYPPSNTHLAEEIVGSGGLLLSEFPLDQAPDKYTFPSRNRLIAGLTRGVLVVEAGEGSGALITADLALDYSREAFAVPGSVFEERSVGCHGLIARGEAQLAVSAADVLRGIGILPIAVADRPVAFTPHTMEESVVHGALSGLPQSLSTLVEACRLPTATVSATMTVLELVGAAKGVGNGLWVRG